MPTGSTDSTTHTVQVVITQDATLTPTTTDQALVSQWDLVGDGEAAAGDGLITHTIPITHTGHLIAGADTGVDTILRTAGDITTVIITDGGMDIMPAAVDTMVILTHPTMVIEDPMKVLTIQATQVDHPVIMEMVPEALPTVEL